MDEPGLSGLRAGAFVLIAGGGGRPCRLGAQRWITLGPLELQPSELMKISLVLALARLPARQERRGSSKPLNLAIALAMIGCCRRCWW